MSAYGKKLESVISVPTSSALLTIDTRDSYQFEDGYIAPNYTNPYNIQIYKNESIFQGRITRLALTEVNMIYSIPNVNPYNNILFLSGSTGPEESIVLGRAFYTPTFLAQQVQIELNALNSGAGCLGTNNWTVSYEPGDATFTIQNGPGGTGPASPGTIVPFKINPKFNQDKGTFTSAGESTSYKRTDTLATMMGFANVPNAVSPTPGVSSVKKTGWRGDVASMLYTTYIDVVSQTLTQNQKVRDVSTNNNTGSNILARIYIGKDFMPLDSTTTILPGPGVDITNNTLQVRPFYINYSPSYVKQVRWNDGIFLSSLNIRLQDDKGNLLYDFERNTTASIPLPDNAGNVFIAGSNGYAQLTFLISESTD